MKPNITKEDVIALREELLDYAENAEQHEFPMLAGIHNKLDKSIEMFDTMDDVEKNAMFRVVYMIIRKDFSEYKKV
jgi:hypothetical protein